MRSIKLLALSLAVLPFSLKPAPAAVVYSFAQSGPTIASDDTYGPSGPTAVRTLGRLTLDDSMLRRPYSLRASNSDLYPGTPAPPPPRGLVDIFFATFDRGEAVVGDLPRFLTPSSNPGDGQDYRLALTGAAGALYPTGTVDYSDGISSARLTFAEGGTVSGIYGTDRGGSCFSGLCAFSGRLNLIQLPGGRPSPVAGPAVGPVPVPEPMSLALFGIGLSALVLVVLRRPAA
jgi:hypothetical protein